MKRLRYVSKYGPLFLHAVQFWTFLVLRVPRWQFSAFTLSSNLIALLISSELRVLGCQFSHDFSSFRDLRWLFCYFHVPRARWVPHPTKFIPKQCSIQWPSERYWFELSMRCKLWDICEKHTNIHTYIHTYIHTWPKPVFHRLLDFGFAPSARSLRLN